MYHTENTITERLTP